MGSLRRPRFYSLLRESGSLTGGHPPGQLRRQGEFLFAVTRERVTDVPSALPRRDPRSRFYSLLRESGSLTSRRDAYGGSRFLFAVTRERVTDVAAYAGLASPPLRFYSLLRESGSLTKEASSPKADPVESFYSLLRESGSLTVTTTWMTSKTVSIRCYARAGH